MQHDAWGLYGPSEQELAASLQCFESSIEMWQTGKLIQYWKQRSSFIYDSSRLLNASVCSFYGPPHYTEQFGLCCIAIYFNTLCRTSQSLQKEFCLEKRVLKRVWSERDHELQLCIPLTAALSE